MYACIPCVGPWRSGEVIRSLGTRVTGSFELPHVGAVNQILIFYKRTSSVLIAEPTFQHFEGLSWLCSWRGEDTITPRLGFKLSQWRMALSSTMHPWLFPNYGYHVNGWLKLLLLCLLRHDGPYLGTKSQINPFSLNFFFFCQGVLSQWRKKKLRYPYTQGK